MSAFICCDKHIASLTNWFTVKQSKTELTQTIANKLKQVNIESVNYRYKEHEPISKCSLVEIVEITAEQAYKMALCLDYQSCELPKYKNPLLVEILDLSDKLRNKSIDADVWVLS